MIRKNLLAIFMAGLMLATIFSAMNVSAGLTSSVSIQPKPTTKTFKERVYEQLDKLDALREEMYQGLVEKNEAVDRMISPIKHLGAMSDEVFFLLYPLISFAMDINLDNLHRVISALKSSEGYDVPTAAIWMETPLENLRNINYDGVTATVNSLSTGLNLR